MDMLLSSNILQIVSIMYYLSFLVSTTADALELVGSELAATDKTHHMNFVTTNGH